MLARRCLALVGLAATAAQPVSDGPNGGMEEWQGPGVSCGSRLMADCSQCFGEERVSSAAPRSVTGLTPEEEAMRAAAAARKAEAKARAEEDRRMANHQLKARVQSAGAATVHSLDSHTKALRDRAKAQSEAAKFAEMTERAARAAHLQNIAATTPSRTSHQL